MSAVRTDLWNLLAKLAVTAWIALLTWAAARVAHFALVTDGNSILGLSGPENGLPETVATEVRLATGMLAVAIAGGVSFVVKDFYKSVKNSNRYAMAFADFRSGALPKDSFQKLVPLGVYVGRFNHTWLFWFLVQPFLSAILGVVAFFIARSGLGVLQGTSSPSSGLTAQSVYLYAVFTFLAGFSSHKFIAWLDRLADKIFSTALPEQKAALRADVAAAAAGDVAELKDEVEEKAAETGKAPAGAGKSAAKASRPQAGRQDPDADEAADELRSAAGTEGVKRVL